MTSFPSYPPGAGPQPGASVPQPMPEPAQPPPPGRTLIELPRNMKQEDLAGMLTRHAGAAELAYASRRAMWTLADLYLRGYRRFPDFNPLQPWRPIQAQMVDEEGNLEFVSQELLHAINQVAGRIETMDVRPSVEPQGVSLEGFRSRAIAEILLSSTVTDDQVREAHARFSWYFAALGCCGLQAHVTDDPSQGLCGTIEVVHPSEIYPFPLRAQASTSDAGLVRVRWVPLTELERVFNGGKAFSAQELARMDVREDAEPGRPPPGDFEQGAPLGGGTGAAEYLSGRTGVLGGPGPGTGRTGMRWARVVTLWLYGECGTVARVLSASGEKLLRDDRYDGLEVWCPLTVVRFMNNGEFHGVGMFDTMFSQHRYLEKLQKAVYQNTIDTDKYGFVLLPQSQIPSEHVTRTTTGRGPKLLYWAPDPVAGDFKPMVVQPFNSGDYPRRVAEYAREGFYLVNPIQDLLREKGRVDNAAGLQLLEEHASRALTSATGGVVRAYGQVYRSLTQQIAAHLRDSPRSLPVTRLTLEMAGARIDWNSGSVDFRHNPLPTISLLSFSIREVSPRSPFIRKRELMEMWEMGLERDPLSLKLRALQDGVDLGVWTYDIQGAYDVAVRVILAVYGDGVEPGRAVITPYTIRPDVLLRLLSGFLTGPAMSYASPQVHEAMLQLRQTALSYLGNVLPAQMPTLDEAVAPQPGMMAGPPPMGAGPGMDEMQGMAG